MVCERREMIRVEGKASYMYTNNIVKARLTKHACIFVYILILFFFHALHHYIENV